MRRLTWRLALFSAALALVVCVPLSGPESPETSDGASSSGACEVSRPQPFAGGPGGVAIVGGDLAYLGQTTWRVNTDEKGPWLRRNDDHTRRLKLRAQRLDVSRAAIVFDLGPPQALPMPANSPPLPPGWGDGYGYGGYAGLGGPKVPEPGCWQLGIVDGSPDDAITVRVI